jgi:hypothetical protein
LEVALWESREGVREGEESRGREKEEEELEEQKEE